MNLRTVLRGVLIVAFMPFAAFAEDFNIIYHLNYGTNYTGAPTTYTAGVGATIDGTPTRNHFSFVGWCTNSGLTQNCSTTQTIGPDATGEKHFYAKWAGDTFNVTYNCGTGATGTPPASTTATYGSTFSPVMIMKNLCENNGNILSGWAISGTNDVKSGTFSWMYAGDKTLTAQWEEFDPKFTITTTNMSANTTFKYWQGSKGLFYVDWGDGTLQTIDNSALISHTYANAGVHTIQFGGLATEHYHNTHNGQNGGRLLGSITFGNFYPNPYADNPQKDNNHSGTPEFISQISGSLGAIYPSLSNANLGLRSQPIFTSTFEGCTNLIGQIPANLFSGVTGGGAIDGCTQTNYAMFLHTFRGCANLGRDSVNGTPTYGIPAGLFGDLSNAGPSTGMFQGTFYGCSGLIGEIPGNLFSGVVGTPNAGLFNSTFGGCTGLSGPIPANLFENISGDASTVVLTCGGGGTYSMEGTTYSIGAVNAFGNTFYNCTNLTGSIPEDLFGRVLPNGTFSGITGNAPYLFANTFRGLEKITGTIPENLFGRVINDTYYGVSGVAKGMFFQTFGGLCSIETPIPPDLFTKTVNGIDYGVSGTAVSLFQSTFNHGRCGNYNNNGLPDSGLTGFIDPDLFRGVTGNSTNIFTATFRNTRMDTVCPCGYHSTTTAWGIDKIPPIAYDPSSDPTGRDAPRAVCTIGLKPNEHYYTGDNGDTVCTTDCDFATNLKTSNGLSYPLFSSQVTVPTMVLKSGDTQCYVPLESGNGGQDSLNLFWGGDTYHAGHEDPED